MNVVYDYRKISTVLEGGNDAVQALVGFSRETSGQYKDGEGRTLVKAVAEAIEIGRRARTRVQVSHHKACGRSCWGSCVRMPRRR